MSKRIFPAELYGPHLADLQAATEEAMEKNGCDRLLLGAGVDTTYFEDDHGTYFRPAPDFAQWVAAETPNHILDIKKGLPPVLHYHYPDGPDNFWLEAIPPAEGVEDCIDVRRYRTIEDIQKALGDAVPITNRTMYIGPAEQIAAIDSLRSQDPKTLANLRNNLNWIRRFKSPYEITCIREAIRQTALGHKSALGAFLAKGTEVEIMLAFMNGSGTTQNDEAFSPVASLDDKTAILHRPQRRNMGNGKVMLLDAGIRFRNLNSDITTTNVRLGANPKFVALLRGLADLQKKLCMMVGPDKPFVELHKEAHFGIAKLLIDNGFLKDISVEAAVMNEYVKAVFPHGLGHLLGVQAHDKGMTQIDPQGTQAQTPKAPFDRLRKTNDLKTGEVVTIEPGIYFIESRLAQFRTDATHSHHFNWELIDKLLGYGMRLESDVHVTKTGYEDLTEKDLPQKTNAGRTFA